jgi:hypothetical protein
MPCAGLGDQCVGDWGFPGADPINAPDRSEEKGSNASWIYTTSRLRIEAVENPCAAQRMR